MLRTLTIATHGQGLYEFTSELRRCLQDQLETSAPGLCTVFLRHTSASLLIQENADPSARHDLEQFFARLVPENDPLYTHTAEGPDDMPAHVKAALTQTSLGIPFERGQLVLGTWQGVFLWEHRTRPHQRQIAVHCCVT